MIEILNQLSAQSNAEWIILISGLIYITLSVLNKPICWVFGIISCGILAWVTWASYNLWADALLQIFYVVMGFVGLYNWTRKTPDVAHVPITRLSSRQLIRDCSLGVLLSLISGKLLADFTPAAATYLDAFSTVFSVIATFWLVKRKWDTWFAWILINTVYVYLYWSRGGELSALLFLVYLSMSFFGLYRWYQIYRKEYNYTADI